MEYRDYEANEEKRWQEVLQRYYKPEPKDGGLAQRIENCRGD